MRAPPSQWARELLIVEWQRERESVYWQVVVLDAKGASRSGGGSGAGSLFLSLSLNRSALGGDGILCLAPMRIVCVRAGNKRAMG